MVDADEHDAACLLSQLLGSLTAAVVVIDKISDADLTEIVGRWAGLVRQRGNLSAEWACGHLDQFLRVMATDPEPRCGRLVARMRRMFHEGQWGSRT
jgi:hypothetical protein